jgi:hypothetical protein
MLPAFALLMIAAGIGLLLEGLPCIGIGIYLLGTRAFMFASKRVSGFLRVLVVIATFQLGRLHETLSPHAYLWLLARAALTKQADLERFAGESEGALGGGRGRARERSGDEHSGVVAGEDDGAGVA